MTRLILFLILAVLVIRALAKLTRGVLEGAGYRRVPDGARSVGLVRDPVCGVFVLPRKALASGTGASAKYFCSEKCRREWGAR